MLDPNTTMHYLKHAFSGIAAVLDRVDDTTVNVNPKGWGTNSIAGLVVHCCELSPSWFEMPGLGRESVRNRDAEFSSEATVLELRERIEQTVARLEPLVQDFATGPTALDHEFRASCPVATGQTMLSCCTYSKSSSNTWVIWKSPLTP